MDLATVAKLVADDKPDKALATMLAVWSKRSLPRLATAIEALDRLVATPWGPLFPAGKVQLDARLTSVNRHGKAPRDPRFTRALFDYLRAMPFTSNDSRAMWSAVFSALVKLEDPRVLAELPAIQQSWTIRPLQRTWLDAMVRWTLEQIEDGPTPTAIETKQLAAIDKAIAAAVPAGGDARRDELLAEVYADPTDDGPRIVLADHLASQDDPRGELITLQLLAKPTPAQTKRIAALLAKHERTWLGSLEPVIAKQGVEFRRGFLAACRVKFKNAMEAERHVRDPAWATVEDLRFTGTRFSYQPFSSQDSGAFLVDPVMASLRSVNLANAADLAQLLRHEWPHLERLAASTERSLGKAGLAALATTSNLPALAAIEMTAPPANWLASTTFGKRLRHVVLGQLGLANGNDTRGPASWLPELARLPALETATIHASRGFGTYPRWTFARDPRGDLSIATVTTTAESYPRAVAMLAALPANQLTTLEVVLTRGAKIAAGQRAAMIAAGERQTRLASFSTTK